MAKTAPPPCRLYLITPPVIDDVPAFAERLDAVLEAGDVACLQIRLKDLDDDTLARAVEFIRPVAQRKNVAVLLNDRPDLAFELGCDGAHIGQEDMSYAQARAALGPDGIIGVTCHDSRHLAMEAAEAGADYVAFGAFFPTETKQAKAIAPIDLIEWWADLMEVPCVAIGGITVENCRPLVQAGADFIAVSAGVWSHPEGPVEAIRQFNAILVDAILATRAP